MRDYIMDMRKTLNELSASYDEMIELSVSHSKEVQECIKSVRKAPSEKTYTYEQSHYENVYYEDIQEGDRLYAFDCLDGYMTSSHYWVEIEITHKYGGFLFYKVINPPTEDEEWLNERHATKGSVFYLMSLMPKKVVIKEGYKFTCWCPYVEFITDENPDSTYPSIFDNTEERRH